MNYYRVGRIVNTFGIKGEVKVVADTDFPKERFAKDNPLVILQENKNNTEVTVENSRLSKGTYIIKFKEYDNINQVESYKNCWLAIPENQQKPLREDEFYFHQIEGLQVYTMDGIYLGHVKEILSLGSNDVWVIQSDQPRRKDILIPYIEDVVKNVDLDNQRVTIELMEGLMDVED